MVFRGVVKHEKQYTHIAWVNEGWTAEYTYD